ncbi:MAG TPA: DnaJ domain-containing protein, partial [Mariprofundaceae bacterium]|nr:DnaJ domain-containing protein [Mariprofundaceae bacterium]
MGERRSGNYYEMLGVRPDASNMDIISAYRQAKLTYRSDSIATYSLFDDTELDQIRADIEQAYLTLSNPEKRQVYDAELAAGRSGRHPLLQEAGSGSRAAEEAPGEAPRRDNVVDLAAQSRVP